MSGTKIYLDSNATSPVHPDLLLELPKVLQDFGNPSSIHWASRGPKSYLREARQNLADLLGAHPLEFIFTSGGSEANSTVIKSVLEECEQPSEFITTQIEHPSIIKTFQYVESKGHKVHYLKLDKSGQFPWDQFSSALSERTKLVSVMLANNETGLILPVKEITQKAHSVGALVHTDMVQCIGKIPVDLKELGVDFASAAGHKFYALKGSGFLYSKKGSDVHPLIFGGGQERRRRGGTENTLGIFAMGYMAKKIQVNLNQRIEKMRSLRDLFETKLKAQVLNIEITHQNQSRLPNTSSLIIDGIDGETLLMNLDLKGFAVSTGAACSSGSPEPSPVLLSLGITRAEAQSSLRVSLNWFTEEQDILNFVDTLASVIHRLRILNSEMDRSEGVEKGIANGK